MEDLTEIRPLRHLDARVTLPGSKSYTQRALLIAALAEGTSRLRNPLLSEDTGLMIDALRALGAGIALEDGNLIVAGTAGKIACPEGEIRLGNNGTAMRFLTAAVCLGRGVFTLTGDPRLCERPIRPLLDALATLGVDARSRGGNGRPPVRVAADGLRGGQVILRDIESSQYVSALLISAPCASGDTRLDLEGRIPSLPYVAMTIEAMATFGQDVARPGAHAFVVRGNGGYRGREYRIEGDASSASYFFLAAALTGGRVRVDNVRPRTLQGDIGLLAILEGLGCRVRRGEDWVEVEGGRLASGDVALSLGDMPDMVPTVAVLAALRPGRTIIRDAAHLRLKESDRLAALAAELVRIGIGARETEDGLVIDGGTPHGAVIETYNDHRIAMSFAILGLVVPGVRIANGACVGKSFPGFWQALEGLYA
jgi:3-phosphoshikimate 1-carboxyvinyltransferase